MPDHRSLTSRAGVLLARARAEQRGLTLVEVMVAAMVLLIGILPTVKVFNDSRDQSATGERHEIALFQAEQALEEMRGLPYDRLLLSAGAVDPGGGRVLDAGASFRVRSDLAETLVYADTEGVPTTNAWVDPVTEVSTGSADAPVQMTIHRFVTWRDEECGVADLSGLGLDLPDAIDEVQSPLGGLLSGPLDSVIGLLSGSSRTTVRTLRTRLTALRDALAARQASLETAIAGVSELDVCDLDATALESVQRLGQLTPALAVGGALNDDLLSLQNSLGGVCVLGICLLRPAQQTAIAAVNGELGCLFGSSTDTVDEFDSYLAGVAAGLGELGGDLADTAKNTKRIMVAVVIEPRNGVGPFEPVWASSVVRDPSAGLLTSGAAACS